MLQLTTIFFLISFSVLAVLHYLSIKLFLYWQLPWLDIPMHLFGGAIVALGVFTLRDLGLLPGRWVSLLPTLLIVFGVSVLWEIFELYAGITIEPDFYIDTLTDFVMGLSGGYIGFIVGSRLRSLNN